jgi:hypothetical protein
VIVALGMSTEDAKERRYDLKLWIGHSHEGATYLPR